MSQKDEFEAWFYSQLQSGRNLPKADMWDAWQASRKQVIGEAVAIINDLREDGESDLRQVRWCIQQLAAEPDGKEAA